MAVTQNTYTGNGSTVLYSFTFPYLDESDIKVEVNGSLTTAYTLANATTIQFNTAPANGALIRIYRATDDVQLKAEFFPGSAVRAQDLNENFNQSLYIAQETSNKAVDKRNPQILGNLDFNNFKGINLATPTANADAANKAYVDSVIATGAANAAAAAASASAAANSYDAFDDRYLGAKATDPSVDNDGNTLLVGAIYFNTTSKVMRVWNGVSWQDASANANVLRWRKTAVGGETSLSGTDNNGTTLTYTVNLEFVYLNGALLQRGVDYTATNGTSITGLVALTTGDVVEVLSYSSFSLVNIPSNTITFTQTGTGAVIRTVDGKLKDVVNVKDFGAIGDAQITNATVNTTAFNNALAAAAGKAVYVPAGTYVINGTITMPSNTALLGEGAASTILVAHPSLAVGTTIIDLSNKNDCMIAFLRIDGSKSTRGVGGGNNIMLRGSRNAVYSVSTIQAPNSGILIDGQTFTADLNRVAECSIEDNGGVGLSQHTARQTYITNNAFARNGLENLTVDNTSHGTIAVGNRFFRHGGGCGNVGWDDGDTSIFSANYIDCENSTVPPADTRNGFCINAEAGVNEVAVISNNVIVNCPDVGIWLRNRTGTGGFAAGSSAITGNMIRNSGSRDIRIGATAQKITLKANNYDTLLVEDAETDVQVGSGEIGFEANLGSNQTFTLSSTFAEVNFNTLAANRLVTRTGNRYTLPAGGFYHLETKVRFTGLTAAGNPEISLRITYPGGSKVINSLTSGNYHELDMSVTRLMGKGDVYVEVRTFGGTGGTSVTLNSGAESYFTCVLIG